MYVETALVKYGERKMNDVRLTCMPFVHKIFTPFMANAAAARFVAMKSLLLILLLTAAFIKL